MVDLERFRENEMDEAEENAIALFYNTTILLGCGWCIVLALRVLFS